MKKWLDDLGIEYDPHANGDELWKIVQREKKTMKHCRVC